VLRAATLFALLVLVFSAPAAAADGPAPGAPGEKAVWTEADKDGFGTATGLRSETWLRAARG
jgi:Glucodextranase, domain N